MRSSHTAQEKITDQRLIISELEMQLREARAVLRGMELILECNSTDGTINKPSVNISTDGSRGIIRKTRGRPKKGLRRGSVPFKAYEVLKLVDKPLHVNDIIDGMSDMENTADNRRHVAAVLRSYHKQQKHFLQTDAATFTILGNTQKQKAIAGTPNGTHKGVLEETPV